MVRKKRSAVLPKTRSRTTKVRRGDVKNEHLKPYVATDAPNSLPDLATSPFSVETPKAMRGRPKTQQYVGDTDLTPQYRKPLDIQALVRLGGGPEPDRAYKLAEKDGEHFATKYSSSTATDSSFVVLGVGKVIEAIRGHDARFGPQPPIVVSTEVECADSFPEELICKIRQQPNRHQNELAKEIVESYIADIPEVNRWGIAPANPPEEIGDVPAVNEFQIKDDIYRITFAGETFHLNRLLGLDYLLLLLRSPGQPMSAAELRSAAVGPSLDARFAGVRDYTSVVDATDKGYSDEDGSHSESKSDFVTHEKIDPQARREYEASLTELGIKLVHAEEINDLAGQDQLKKEILFLKAELSGSVDLHGRIRQFSGPGEAARVSVTKTIQYATLKIENKSPALAAHLRVNVVTGSTIAYRDCKTPWKL